MTDFLIVGRGLAATCLMHRFHQNNLTFKVIGKSDLSRCSHVAAGIWNPVVFKRLTKSWMADELIPELNIFYSECESLLGEKFVTQREIIKPFIEKQEEITWVQKSKNEMDDYLDPNIYNQESAPDGASINGTYGRVKNCGNLDVSKFLVSSHKFFNDHIIDHEFSHKDLVYDAEHVSYQNIKASRIVFCEGWLVNQNPFFNWLPLKPAKGEILTIACPGLELGNTILNRGSFLFKLSERNYKSGATYDWDNLNESTTITALEELSDRLSAMLRVPFTVEKQEAGVRPASIDRRPILGVHPELANFFVFNGLGTKGVMLAPYFTNKFVNFCIQKQKLAAEVDVRRFYNLYEAKK